MRQRPDKPMPGAGRQLRVEIQSDDVTNVLEQGCIPRLHRELVILIQQEAVEVEKLAAFSLPTHPQLFRRVVLAMPMEMKKSPFVFTRDFFIEFPEESGALLDQRFLIVKLLR